MDTEKKGYTCYTFINTQLENSTRNQLLELFPPKYETVYAHHATEDFDVPMSEWSSDSRAYKSSTDELVVYGYIDTGDGLEVLLVEIEGKRFRPDGEHYHITWSLDPDSYKPYDSVRVIQDNPYKGVDLFTGGCVYWFVEFD